MNKKEISKKYHQYEIAKLRGDIDFHKKKLKELKKKR